MNAAKFIADKGWEYTKTHLEKMDTENWHNDWFKDLKRYVDAWELVQSWGGINDARVVVSVSRHKKYLKRAIALVEEVESLREEG